MPLLPVSPVGATAVGDWMLLAAIAALIEDHAYLANYHLAWFIALSHLGR